MISEVIRKILWKTWNSESAEIIVKSLQKQRSAVDNLSSDGQKFRFKYLFSIIRPTLGIALHNIRPEHIVTQSVSIHVPLYFVVKNLGRNVELYGSLKYIISIEFLFK